MQFFCNLEFRVKSLLKWKSKKKEQLFIGSLKGKIRLDTKKGEKENHFLKNNKKIIKRNKREAKAKKYKKRKN